jgi:alpha-1,3-mannosyltransferase
MKILHVVRQFLPSIGGLEDVVYNLALEQIKNGNQVEVFTLNTDFQTDGQLSESEIVNNIYVKRFSWIGSKRYSLCILPTKLLNEFDVIHVHAVDFFVEYISFLKRLKLIKPKLVLTTHGGFFHTKNNAKLKKIFFKYITPFSLSKFDCVTCCSVNDFELFKGLNNKVVMIENGVGYRKLGDIPTLKEKISNEDSFIYFGRFSDNKRLALLIEFFSKNKNKNVRLKIIGRSKTGDTQILFDTVKYFKATNVDLVFDITDAEILKHIYEAKFTISASEYEGFGLSIIELMSYGLVPLLSSNPPSFSRFITESKCGELFESNVGSFTTALDNISFNWKPEMALLAEKYSKSFSWVKVSEKYFDVYR